MKKSLPFRSWYYFRTGYATYLTFIIASLNTLVTVYYLAIKNVPTLKEVFPSFGIWTAVMIFVFVPLGVFIGWLHLKRSPAYRSEVDVALESNPYYYKLTPGIWKEAFAPAILEILRLNLKILSKESLNENEIDSLKSLQKKLETLIDGGFVGEPKEMS